MFYKKTSSQSLKLSVRVLVGWGRVRVGIACLSQHFSVGGATRLSLGGASAQSSWPHHWLAQVWRFPTLRGSWVRIGCQLPSCPCWATLKEALRSHVTVPVTPGDGAQQLLPVMTVHEGNILSSSLRPCDLGYFQAVQNIESALLGESEPVSSWAPGIVLFPSSDVAAAQQTLVFADVAEPLSDCHIL